MQRDYDANNSNLVTCSSATADMQMLQLLVVKFNDNGSGHLIPIHHSLAGGRSSLMSGSTSCGVLTATGRGSAVHRLVTSSVSCFDALGTDMVITAGPRLARTCAGVPGVAQWRRSRIWRRVEPGSGAAGPGVPVSLQPRSLTQGSDNTGTTRRLERAVLRCMIGLQAEGTAHQRSRGPH